MKPKTTAGQMLEVAALWKLMWADLFAAFRWTTMADHLRTRAAEHRREWHALEDPPESQS